MQNEAESDGILIRFALIFQIRLLDKFKFWTDDDATEGVQGSTKFIQWL